MLRGVVKDCPPFWVIHTESVSAPTTRRYTVSGSAGSIAMISGSAPLGTVIMGNSVQWAP